MVSTPAGGSGASAQTMTRSASGQTSSSQPALRSRMGTRANGTHSNPGPPLSARHAERMDLVTVECRGNAREVREPMKPRNRPHAIPEAPTFHPTVEEFRDPLEYMRKIAAEGSKYGIVKIIPPDGWNPQFAIDTTKFHFRTRRQELNSVEGATRSNLNYLDQLAKFHRQHGNNLNRFPSVDKRPLDLYELKKAVECRGGFERVCKGKKWAEIGRDLGYSGKIMSSLSTSLKTSYQKWLHPYEEYLRVAKPGVQQMLEYENGGPFTPSPNHSPMKHSSSQATPNVSNHSPAVRASTALHESITGSNSNSPASVEPLAKPLTSGFTAVNSGGFTAINSAAPPPGGFSTANTTNDTHRDRDIKREAVTPSERHPSAVENGSPHAFSTNGTTFSKRPLSEIHNGATPTDLESPGRRSKRIKQENAPTVTGSQMNQPRSSTPRVYVPRDRSDEKPGEVCEACGRADEPTTILLCDSCDHGYHRACLEPPLKSNPDYDWHCPKCLVGTGEFGFEDGGIYSLKQFKDKAAYFKENYFASKMPFDPVYGRRPVSEDDVEREFWRLVQSITETVEVEYGADIHSTTHGSGFPTIERHPRDPYSVDPWNLNNLPLCSESLFRHIKTDISGMTVPWLYVGMCFSTFCWHNEDHYTYSANYQHFGDTKTWYGIPGEDASRFEAAMQAAVPELFEQQPDLLFQLVTLLPPDQLRKAGVRVYALDQRAGQFVITYPQAYHAGFNHGFNFNEAVNFAPSDWEPFGQAGVQRLRDFRRQPCFSHDELLLTAAGARDVSIKTAKWLAPALQKLLERETQMRDNFRANVIGVNVLKIQQQERVCEVVFDTETDAEDVHEDEYVCSYCKGYSYLSRLVNKTVSKISCLDHLEYIDWGNAPDGYELHYRIDMAKLEAVVQKTWDKARVPEVWQEKFEKAIEDDPRPQLKLLRSLVSEAERIPWEMPGLRDLRKFVHRCNTWVEEAMNYITRKQQNRRKNEKVWRRGSKVKVDEEEREREARKLDNITRLLKQAEEIGFDCPEIATLQERADSINTFREDARLALSQIATNNTQQIEELVELGRSFYVEIPEVEALDRILRQMKWVDVVKARILPGTLQEVKDLIKEGLTAGISEQDPKITMLMEQQGRGEMWEAKALELMAVENVHFAQLDTFSKQAAEVPVNPETLASIDAILKKQREAQDQIISLYERSKHPDIRQRPQYREVREVMESLGDLNSKPPGTLDLEREQKRHEDWMRAGKKLFGKSNAPLHILLSHMQIVEARNEACFDLRDKPRTPVEPASREQTPDLGQSGSSRDVFCICRTRESGMMIECAVCGEWYHGKCFKVARGKVKDDDVWTCPICDWRVKIPRDAARPKLEDLIGWQHEIATLPFQPEEEACLENIVEHAQAFRDYISGYMSNGMVGTFAEVPEQRFWLRKIEGADILLTLETNFFRQELHRLMPIAPDPPPIVEESASTRKPRPTKQQKLMKEMGVENPEDLPPQFRTKAYGAKKAKGPGGKPGTDESPTDGSPGGPNKLDATGHRMWEKLHPDLVGPAQHGSRQLHPTSMRQQHAAHHANSGTGPAGSPSGDLSASASAGQTAASGLTPRGPATPGSGPLSQYPDPDSPFQFHSSGSNGPYTANNTLAPPLGSPSFSSAGDAPDSALDPTLFGSSAALPAFQESGLNGGPADDGDDGHAQGLRPGSAAGSAGGGAFESMFADLTNSQDHEQDAEQDAHEVPADGAKETATEADGKAEAIPAEASTGETKMDIDPDQREKQDV